MAEFQGDRCGVRIPGNSERTGEPEPIEFPSCGAERLLMVSGTRKDSQLQLP